VRGAGPLGVEVSHRVAGRVLLAGDAAGYVDALTGEGISLAWECGAALVAATEAGNPARYEADWRRLTRRHRWLTAGLLEVAARPWLRRGVVRALALSPSGFSTMLGVNTGAIGGIRSLPE
jgi:flavin-dependent dehydrogenase